MSASAMEVSLARRLRDLPTNRKISCAEMEEKVQMWRKDPGLEPSQYINLGNANGKTALHFAAQLRGDGFAELLISLRADVDRTTVRGHTPLIYAAGRGREDVILSLLAARANAHVRTATGDTALGVATRAPDCEHVVAKLEAAEAAEERPWLDFTVDARAIAAQADHVEKCAHAAQWACDIPARVAEELALRRAAASEVTAKQVSKSSALAEQLAGILQRARNGGDISLGLEFGNALLQAAASLSGSGKRPGAEKALKALKDAIIASYSCGGAGEGEEEPCSDRGALCLLHAAAGLPKVARAPGASKARSAKESRLTVTSALLAALKELPRQPVQRLVEVLPPWMILELLRVPRDVDLVRDGPALEGVLRALCHKEAWGSDYRLALHWLKRMKPEEEDGVASTPAVVAAYGSLQEVFLDATRQACQEGRSLKRHWRDGGTLLQKIQEVLGNTAAQSISQAIVTADEADSAAKVLKEEVDMHAALRVPFMELPTGVEVRFLADAVEWSAAEQTLVAASTIAVDTEWWETGQGPALVQVATASQGVKHCFLLDTLCAPEVFRPGLLSLAARRDLLILGWSFSEDQKRMLELLSPSSEDADTLHASTGASGVRPIEGGATPQPPQQPQQQLFRVLDLQRCCCRLLGRTTPISLSAACTQLLGRPLDKTEQCSDWRRRPLTQRQADYAALDSLVLLELWQELRRRGIASEDAAAGPRRVPIPQETLVGDSVVDKEGMSAVSATGAD